MSFFAKLRQTLGGPTPRASDPELEALRADRRLHARFSVAPASDCRILFANGVSGTVFDMSYSGLACRFPAGVEIGGQTQARLFVLDTSVEVVVSPVRAPGPPRDGQVYIGLQVLHQKPESLVFMRDVIEPLRSGQTLQPIPEPLRKEQYRSSEWVCLRGEGPVDLIVRSAGGHPVEALLTFATSGRYCELMLKDGQVKTGLATGPSSSIAPGANMTQTTAPDPVLVRRAAFILMGAPEAIAPLTRPMLDAALAALGHHQPAQRSG